MNQLAHRLVLKEHHPTMQKYAKLADLAEELGISIEFDGGRCCVRDRDRDPTLPTLYLEDIEDNYVYGFPHDFEYKMVYDNPVYLAEEKRKHEEWLRQVQEEEDKKKLELKKKAEEEERRRQEQQERREKQLLVELKQKYEQQV